MTLTLKFEIMSSNFVCNEAFSEGHQTGSSVTPELPTICRELEADDEKRSLELNSRLTEMRNTLSMENKSLNENSRDLNNQVSDLSAVSKDTRIVDSQNTTNYQINQNQVQSEEITAHSFSKVDSEYNHLEQQQQQFHQNSTSSFLQTENPERQRTHTGNSTLSKNSTQSNSSTITGRIEISKPLLNPNNGITSINDPRYSLTVSLTGDLENQTHDRARLFDNQEKTTHTTSPSRMDGQIRDYNYQHNITGKVCHRLSREF